MLVLLLAGAAAAAWAERQAARELGQPGLGAARWLIFAGGAGLALLPPVRRAINALLDRVRRPSPSAAERTAVAVAFVAAGYFLFTALHQDRDLFPKTHDEGSYAIQMRMLAGGRLWMPQHPLADFFDTFYVITRPVYASQYFPGTALMYVPSVWLGWPSWLPPLLASGAIVGLVYRLVTDLVDGAAGLLAALMMVSLNLFRMLSVLLFSQVPMLLLGLLTVWAWMRWRRSKKYAWLAAVGAFAGWGAITRPADALCFAIPVGAAIGCELARDGRAGMGRRFARAAALLVAGAAPFLLIQLYTNQGVTGSPLKTPFGLYARRDFPGTRFGFPRFDPAARPQSSLPQKQELYERWAVDYVKRHQPKNVARSWIMRWLPMIVAVTLPARFMLVLSLVGLLGLTTVPRRAVFATLPLFILAYVPHTFFLEHYPVVVAPALALGVVLGIRVLEETWPRFAGAIRSVTAAAIGLVCLTSLYELNPQTYPHGPGDLYDETFRSPMLRYVNGPMRTQVQKPAVVLFRYAPGQNPIEEPVYNTDVAWPDDAPIIRAHDLGDRNREIFQYYARVQPERTFYRFDRKTGTLSLLGPAPALAAAQTAP